MVNYMLHITAEVALRIPAIPAFQRSQRTARTCNAAKFFAKCLSAWRRMAGWHTSDMKTEKNMQTYMSHICIYIYMCIQNIYKINAKYDWLKTWKRRDWMKNNEKLWNVWQCVWEQKKCCPQARTARPVVQHSSMWRKRLLSSNVFVCIL